MTNLELLELSAVEAVAAMRNGSLRSERYAQALLDRAARLERLNAFRTLRADHVLEAARSADQARAAGAALGRLHGLPIPVKDSVNTRALPTSNGARALERFQPARDAAVLDPLFAQGAILMGKTNIHEMSRGWTSNNLAFGAVRNPHDEARIPGGSSGGSAAAVAACMAPLAIAEDTLGSIRIPASLCGIAGLRPTYGRYPNSGTTPLTKEKFDQVGPLARNVADLALFDAVVTGDARPITAAPLHGVRIGISRDDWLAGLEPAVERVVHEALERLGAAGVELVDVHIAEEFKAASYIAGVIIAFENQSAISDFLAAYGSPATFHEVLAQASPLLRAAYDAPPPARETYESALRSRETLRAMTHELFRSHNVQALAFPSALAVAPPIGDNLEFEIRGERVSIRTVMSRNTSLGSVASLCSVVLPAGLSPDGLPVGMEFAGRSGADRELLALGLSLEGVLGAAPAPKLGF